jgi:hypothetical protein
MESILLGVPNIGDQVDTATDQTEDDRRRQTTQQRFSLEHTPIKEQCREHQTVFRPL